jgi:hypothetical protein
MYDTADGRTCFPVSTLLRSPWFCIAVPRARLSDATNARNGEPKEGWCFLPSAMLKGGLKIAQSALAPPKEAAGHIIHSSYYNAVTGLP